MSETSLENFLFVIQTQLGYMLGTSFGIGAHMVTMRDGTRCNAPKGYLRGNLQFDGDLTFVPNAHVSRVIIDKGRAVGVEYVSGKTKHTATADGEVIVSCGAIQSPQLLMLSGIGPANELQKHNIDVQCDLPGVGRNLQAYWRNTFFGG